MPRSGLYYLSLLIVFCIYFFIPFTSHAAKLKVLVVMSYEQDFAWCKNIKQGIDSAVGDSCEIRYFYMDTKKDFENGRKKAKQAFELYKTFEPDGVIAADDNAQSMFVVPYLQDKVKTPVMFCGVNAEPEKYNYPCSNVSGILERNHVNQTIAFAQQLLPSIKTIGFITTDSPVGNLLLHQIQKESDTYLAKFVAFKLPKTMNQAILMAKELKPDCDALFTPVLQGIAGEKGPLDEKEAIHILAKEFGKPVLSNAIYNVKYGALCAVIQNAKEQGCTAAKMLIKAMQGTLISDIPITRNHKGKRVINVTVMNALGIKPRPEILRGAELVRTEE